MSFWAVTEHLRFIGLFSFSYLYWTEYIHKHAFTTLHRFNLKNSFVETLNSFSSSRHQLSRALTFDPTTDRLWVSSQSSGLIVSCDPSLLPWWFGSESLLINNGSQACTIEFNVTELTAATGTGKKENLRNTYVSFH